MATPIKTRIEALQRAHDTATTEVTELEAKIRTLEEERAALKLPASMSGASTPAERRASEIGSQVSTMRASIEDLTKHKIRSLEKRLNYLIKAESAPRDMAAARAANAKALEEIAGFAARRQQVETKLAAMLEETKSANEQVDEAERLAGQTYAQAVADGNESAMEAACTSLKEAQETRLLIERRTKRQNVVIEAMTAEIARLESEESEAEARAQAARVAFFDAVKLKYAEQWDAAVEQLSIAGANLSAAAQLANHSVRHLFSDLKIQYMEPELSFLHGDRIRRQGEELELPESL